MPNDSSAVAPMPASRQHKAPAAHSIREPAEDEATQRQTGHKDREDGAGRVYGAAERSAEHSQPNHFVYQPAEAGYEEEQAEHQRQGPRFNDGFARRRGR